jgi:hypothetical protein
MNRDPHAKDKGRGQAQEKQAQGGRTAGRDNRDSENAGYSSQSTRPSKEAGGDSGCGCDSTNEAAQGRSSKRQNAGGSGQQH